MQRLQDRVAVITGAGSGIGLATARRFAEEGARVVCVDLDETTGAAAATRSGGLFVQADVTDEDDVVRMFQTAFDTYGGVDIAFNNAGISPPDDDSILETGIDAWAPRPARSTSPRSTCAASTPSRTCGGGARGRSSTPRRSSP